MYRRQPKPNCRGGGFHRDDWPREDVKRRGRATARARERYFPLLPLRGPALTTRHSGSTCDQEFRVQRVGDQAGLLGYTLCAAQLSPPPTSHDGRRRRSRPSRLRKSAHPLQQHSPIRVLQTAAPASACSSTTWDVSVHLPTPGNGRFSPHALSYRAVGALGPSRTLDFPRSSVEEASAASWCEEQQLTGRPRSAPPWRHPTATTALVSCSSRVRHPPSLHRESNDDRVVAHSTAQRWLASRAPATPPPTAHGSLTDVPWRLSPP